MGGTRIGNFDGQYRFIVVSLAKQLLNNIFIKATNLLSGPQSLVLITIAHSAHLRLFDWQEGERIGNSAAIFVAIAEAPELSLTPVYGTRVILHVLDCQVIFWLLVDCFVFSVFLIGETQILHYDISTYVRANDNAKFKKVEKENHGMCPNDLFHFFLAERHKKTDNKYRHPKGPLPLNGDHSLSDHIAAF